MKKIMLAVTIGVTAFAAATAWGTPTVTLSGGSFQNGIGGEFTVTPNAEALSATGTPNLAPYVASYVVGLTGSASSFQTFCIEYNEHFNWNGSYQYGVSGGAIRGGTTSTDLISVGTAWLYSQFAEGTLANYFGVNRNANAGALQNAIWYLEGEISTISAGNIYYNAAVAQFGSFAALSADASGNTAAYYGVYALNMGDPNANPPYPNQDQLIYLKGGHTDVPDGGLTLALLGSGLAALSLLRRKLA
jgi:hypothetical protein